MFAALGQLLILKLNTWAGRSLIPVAGWGSFMHMLMPALVLGLGTMAYLTRLMRSSMLDVTSSGYIRTARAKGLSPLRIFFYHQLRNAVLPVLTVLGPTVTTITTGGFVVELVFAIPGLGRYFVGGAATRLHRNHGYHGFLRCISGAHGDIHRYYLWHC